MSYTTYRTSLRGHLATSTGVSFVDGKLQAGAPDHDIGCVWPLRVQELGSDVSVERIFLAARVFKVRKQQTDPQTPAHDPADLEDLAQDVMDAVSTHQTGLGPWFQRVTEVTYDVDENAIECVIEAWQLNQSLY